MRLATWNVNSLTARLPRVTEWIDLQSPDILCLQETKQADSNFPYQEFRDLGYESTHFGDGGWNGVAILSRVGLEDPAFGFGTPEDAYGHRFLAATCNDIRVHSVYVPNGRSLDNEFYGFKLRWLNRLRSYLDETKDPSSNVVVAGDFNVAPMDSDVWDIEHFAGMTHVSDPERQALSHVLDWGLVDVFTQFNPPGTFSWWDYRGGSFHKGHGMRIDLALLSQSLAERALKAWVDRDARKGTKPSDHAPVVIDLEYD